MQSQNFINQTLASDLQVIIFEINKRPPWYHESNDARKNEATKSRKRIEKVTRRSAKIFSSIAKSTNGIEENERSHRELRSKASAPGTRRTEAERWHIGEGLCFEATHSTFEVTKPQCHRFLAIQRASQQMLSPLIPLKMSPSLRIPLAWQTPSGQHAPQLRKGTFISFYGNTLKFICRLSMCMSSEKYRLKIELCGFECSGI